jgi:5-methylcytosine-specific restriction endonuclease McrA
MQVLLLNNSYEPLKVISWQKAIILLFKEKVAVVEEYNHHLIRSEKLVLKMPAVIQLHHYVNPRNYQTMRFSKENIFFRDNYTCAYCGQRFCKTQLTLDHVVPFSRGGKKTWSNIVTACHECNNKKGDRDLHQLEFKLLTQPHKPPIYNYLTYYNKLQHIPDQWKNYLCVENMMVYS